MRLSKILAIALENMTQRKMRTSLTTLGVVIGITAIIGLASLGEGFRIGIKDRMQQGFELDVLIVIPGSFTAAMREPFRPAEIKEIRTVSGVDAVAPLITMPQATLNTENDQKLKAFTVAAVNFSEITQVITSERLVPINGTIPHPEDDDAVVLGYNTCFINETAPLVNVGETVVMQIEIANPPIRINRTLRVAAILGKSGTPGITNFDYWAFIPLNTAINLTGQETYNIILVKVSDPGQSDQVAKAIETTFANPYAVSILVPIAFMRQVDRILSFVQLFLMAIASISLLVAGIGIMNIMTVSVMERTREIGILKAIGAKSRTILAMFLAEAALIGVIGGLAGVFAGYGLAHALAYMLSGFIQPQHQDVTFQAPEPTRMTINPIFSLEWTIATLVFAIVVCVVFGLYPARKAAKLDPVKALRYE